MKKYNSKEQFAEAVNICLRQIGFKIEKIPQKRFLYRDNQSPSFPEKAP